MDDNGWIAATTRLPTEEDADPTGCVLAWHRYNGAMVIGWHQLEKNRMVTHWQASPPVPMDYPREYREMWLQNAAEVRRKREAAIQTAYAQTETT